MMMEWIRKRREERAERRLYRETARKAVAIAICQMADRSTLMVGRDARAWAGSLILLVEAYRKI